MSCLSVLRTFSLAFLCAASLLAQQFPSEQQRLLSIAKLWTTIKYFHPYIASKPIDWDKALVDALPAIRNAKSDSEFAAAAQSLLSPLHDPLTIVELGGHSPVETGSATGAQRTWIHHGLPSALSSASGFYQAFAVKSSSTNDTVALTLTPGITAQVRLSEPAKTSVMVPEPSPDSDYAETPYPSGELRILSAFRIWGAIHNFFAYKDLMDEDWDAIFADSLPKFIAANNARSYHLAAAEMISRLSDSNSTAQSPELDQYFGAGSPGFRVRLVEKKTVVTEILDPAVKLAGLQIGDIITSIDGERLTDRIKREATYIPASTPQAFSAAVVRRLLNGPLDSSATFTVSRVDDLPRTLTLKRTAPLPDRTAAVDLDKAVHLVASNIGYVDLTQLSLGQVSAAFEKLQNTTAIIFDARGPIAPMSAEIASCLTTHPDAIAAIVTGPLSLEPDLPRPGISTTTSSYFSLETIRNSCRTPYKGKTIMLIDERTIGNAEHLGLMLEVANNTEFLGMPSAGADSAVTEFTAPGGLRIRFSGTDIRHANAGPIQRMGLQPSLALAPKIAAIRSGHDVVLEKAIEYLRPPATQAKLDRLQQMRAFGTQSDNQLAK